MLRPLAVAAALFLGLPAASASASSATLVHDGTMDEGGVHVESYTVVIAGDPGEANEFTVENDGRDVTVRDAGAALSAGPGCAAVDAQRVSCDISTQEGFLRLGAVVDAGDGDDSIAVGGFFAAVTLRGGAGDDVIAAGEVPATIDGGPGADDLSGGAGDGDRVVYDARTAPVQVTLNGVADDGEAGEGDDVATDFEIIEGGAGDDVLDASGRVLSGHWDSRLVGHAGHDLLVGSGFAELLVGGLGDDVLRAGDGSDRLDGGQGADVLEGGPGANSVDYAAAREGVTVVLDGAAGDGEPGEGDTVAEDIEFVTGSPYRDVLVGGAAAETLRGGGGRDVIRGRGGGDTLQGSGYLDGGAGSDTLRAGGGRTVLEARDGEVDWLSCPVPEKVVVRADRDDDFRLCRAHRPPGVGDVRVRPRRVLIGDRGRGRFRAFVARHDFHGEFELVVGRVKVGGGRLALKRDGWHVMRFTLNRTGRQTLERERRLETFVAFTGVDGSGRGLAEYDELTLVRPD